MGTGIWEMGTNASWGGSSPSPNLEVICGVAAPHGCRTAEAGPRAATSVSSPTRRWSSPSIGRAAVPAPAEHRFSRKSRPQGERRSVASGVTLDGA